MNAEHKQTCREALVSKIENTEAMIHALKAMRDSIYGITAKESAELEKMQLCLTGLRAALAALDEPPTGWQPLPDGEYSVDGVNPSYRLSVSGGNLAAGWARSGNMDEIFIGEYRLFRRTPAAGE